MWNYLQAACRKSPDSSDAKRAVELLFDTALISSGFTVSTVEHTLFFLVLHKLFLPNT